VPLPKQLQPLLEISAADCETAEVVIVSDQQEQQQHAEQLEAVVQHMRAAGIAALDVEFYQDASLGSSSSSMSSLDEEDETAEPEAAAAASQGLTACSSIPLEHNRFQQRVDASRRRLALVQLMVPAADSAAGSWPAAIYLVQVPCAQVGAHEIASQLQAAFQDDQIVKVVHYARQVSSHH
jgi:hypothetical protein